MTPYEILLSESRRSGCWWWPSPPGWPRSRRCAPRGSSTATPIGRVTDDGIFRVRHHGQVVAAIPGQRLVDDCPIYHPEAREARRGRAPAGPRARRPSRRSISRRALPALLDAPTIASKRWVYEQYDSTVQASTVLGPGGDAGVLRVPGTGFGLAVSVDCNNRLVALDPYEGGKAAVAEAARNVACTGARPLGITDCLNFGNPEKPEVFFQFREACRGIADACRAFETPVTGGNVSFYNESPTGAVDPTPTVGMVGLLERVERRVPSHFAAEGDADRGAGRHPGRARRLGLLGRAARLRRRARPPVDLDAEAPAAAAAWWPPPTGACCGRRTTAPRAGCSVTLAEAAIGGPYAAGGFGAAIVLDGYAPDVSLEGLLYGEDMRPGGRVLRPRRRRRPARALPRPWRAGVRGGPGRGSRAARWNSGSGAGCSVGASVLYGRPISRRFPVGCGSPTRIARRGHSSMCGIIGVSGVPDAARLTYLGLYALQHRGQESAGIVAVDRDGMARAHRGMGLVSENFDESILGRLPGDVAVGHTRYSTTGSTVLANAQPCSVNTRCGTAGHRPQRQPHQRRGDQAGPGREGRHLHHLVRHRGAGAPDRPLRGRHGRGPDPGRAGAGGGRLQPGDHASAARCTPWWTAAASGRWCWAGWGAGWWWPRRPARSTWWAPPWPASSSRASSSGSRTAG